MADPLSIVAYAAAAVVFGEAIRKAIVNQRLGHEFSRFWMALGLALIAVSLVVGAPATIRWSDQHMGVRNLGILVHSVTAMAAMVCVVAFLRTVEQTTIRLRTVLSVFATCIGVLVVLYLLHGKTDHAFAVSDNHHPASVAFSVLYLVYMISCLVLFVRGVWRGSRGEDRVVQFGVFLAALGVGVGLLGLVWKLAAVLTSVAGYQFLLFGRAFPYIAQIIGAALFAAGSVFAAAVRRLHDRRHHDRAREVTRLWHVLEPVRVETTVLRGTGQPGLRQQVVEIQDARLFLRAHIHPNLRRLITEVSHARNVRGRRALAVAVAAELRGALLAFQEGIAAPPAYTKVDARPQHTTLVADDDNELAWLADISRAMHHPAVEEVVARAQACVAKDRATR
ncbi:MAB_1171c family putative transporter [Saccharomonospora sp. NPDC046836]|uniref:MAB_1171c family putative transporter n=1 Tax=Saccharomonospora sp. NPDC046836 TaxID=3156921 RepID=UPI0033E65702